MTLFLTLLGIGAVVAIVISYTGYLRDREDYLLVVSKDSWMSTLQIRDAVAARRGKEVSIGEVHFIMDALKLDGFVESRHTDKNIEQRGGRKTLEYRRTNKKFAQSPS